MMKTAALSALTILLIMLLPSCKENAPTEPEGRTLILTDSIACYSDDDLSREYAFDGDSAAFANVIPPQAATRVSPVYPDKAAREGTQGDVFVDALVMGDGSVIRAVVWLSTDIIFNRPSLEATMKWTFIPATYNGDRINVWVRIPFHYRMVR